MLIHIFVMGVFVAIIKRTAEARGRNPLFFSGLAIVLWIGCAISGIIITLMNGFDEDMTGIPALVCGIAGGSVAYLITRVSKPGTYVLPELPELKVSDLKDMKQLLGAILLPKARTVKIIREKTCLGVLFPYKVSLNGEKAGKIGDRGYMLINTPYTQNALTIKGKTLYFSIQPDADDQMPEIYFKGNVFLPDRCLNCQILDPAVMELK